MRQPRELATARLLAWPLGAAWVADPNGKALGSLSLGRTQACGCELDRAEGPPTSRGRARQGRQSQRQRAANQRPASQSPPRPAARLSSHPHKGASGARDTGQPSAGRASPPSDGAFPQTRKSLKMGLLPSDPASGSRSDQGPAGAATPLPADSPSPLRSELPKTGSRLLFTVGFPSHGGHAAVSCHASPTWGSQRGLAESPAHSPESGPSCTLALPRGGPGRRLSLREREGASPSPVPPQAWPWPLPPPPPGLVASAPC